MVTQKHLCKKKNILDVSFKINNEINSKRIMNVEVIMAIRLVIKTDQVLLKQLE